MHNILLCKSASYMSRRISFYELNPSGMEYCSRKYSERQTTTSLRIIDLYDLKKNVVVVVVNSNAHFQFLRRVKLFNYKLTLYVLRGCEKNMHKMQIRPVPAKIHYIEQRLT